MRVLLDCSRISTGGGIQGALAVLQNATETPEHEWHVVMSAKLSAEVPGDWDRFWHSVVRLDRWRTPFLRKLPVPWFMSRHEFAVRPHIVFSVFGPVFWRPQSLHLVGFALPHLIYPETDVLLNYGSLLRPVARLRLELALRSFRRADYLVVETDTVRNRLEAVLGIPRSRVFVVRNTYSPLFAASLKHEPSKPTGMPFTIFVPSAAYPHKNLRCIPSVCSDLEHLGQRDFQFVLTLPQDSPSWLRLQKVAERLSVGRRLRTVGHIPHGQLSAYYQQADGIFLPSLLECSTAVYPETFMTGLPLVTSKLDFALELCGNAALYINPQSSMEAAMAWAQLISDPQLRDRLVENGKKQLSTSFITHKEKWLAQLECMTSLALRNA